MIIKKLKVEKPFMYIWLKTVKNVDLSKHCARCLIGEYDNRINNKIHLLNNIILEDNNIYFFFYI